MHQAGNHAVQFYDSEPDVQRAIAQYFCRSADPTAPLVMISRGRTFAAVGEHLASGLYGPTIAPDRLLFVDADAVLSQCMQGQHFVMARVELLFKDMLAQLPPNHTDGPIGLYGEMVDILCEHGQHNAALELEHLAPVLINLKPQLSILCSYATDRFKDDTNAARFDAVCKAHTHVFPAEGAADAAQAETIYIVDDDESLRNALKRVLKSSSRDVRLFASAEEFLAVSDNLERGCLIVDIQLKGMSGFELLLRLMDAGVSWPIIVMSGMQDQKVENTVLQLGARAYLHKPFETPALLEAVRHALSRNRG